MRLRNALAAVVVLGMTACVPPTSRVATGQLYAAGKPPYDDYFREVHEAQVDAASWADEKRASHKALVAALALTPDAPDVTLVQATHERAAKYASHPGALRLEVTGTDAKVVGSSEGSDLFPAVEESAHGELERAKRMHALEPKLEALEKSGHDLEPRVKDDFSKYGGQKLRQVEGELSASYDVLGKLTAQAKREAREAEDFVADLQRAFETASADKNAKPAPASTGRRPEPPPPKPRKEPSGTAGTSPKPSPKPPAEPSSKPPPKPAPKPADTGEVFTP